MKVLVRSFPPNLNANYGGVLQAWALQKVLRGLGHEVAVDASSSNTPSPLARRLKRRVVELALGALPAQLVPERFGLGTALHRMDLPILQFASQHMRLDRLYTRSGTLRRFKLGQYQAFVAGSDQVFRPDYVNVESYLFDFLPDDFTGPKVSYAASFGSDAPAFSAELIAKTAMLARRLTAVSVREESGVSLCADLWGVGAIRLIDPTLLLDAETYRQLIGANARPMPEGDTVAYILDDSDSKRQVVERIGTARGRRVNDIRGRVPTSYRQYRQSPSSFDRPTIEAWLASLANADCIVTDSFHGCVFAIVFERPFLVIPNRERGLARFETLLSVLGLGDRMLDSYQDAETRMSEPIDWVQVRARRDSERERALSFLRQSLRG